MDIYRNPSLLAAHLAMALVSGLGLGAVAYDQDFDTSGDDYRELLIPCFVSYPNIRE